MTGGLEQEILTILRERRLFEIASRTHAKWKDDLEAKYPKGFRGELNLIVRSTRKIRDKIASFGPEALVDDLLPRFVYATGRAFEGDELKDKEVGQRIEELADELIRFTKALRE